MVTRTLIALALAGIVTISLAGCVSANRPNSLPPTATLAPIPSPTPQAPRVGNSAPDFTLDNLDGTQKVHLSDFRGKAVLLHFWAITCPPCVKELPIIQRFYAQQQAAGKDFVVLAVDIDDVTNFVKVARLRQQLSLTYSILVDDHFSAQPLYQVTDVPVSYFIDRQGFIRSILKGPLDDATLRKTASSMEA